MQRIGVRQRRGDDGGTVMIGRLPVVLALVAGSVAPVVAPAQTAAATPFAHAYPAGVLGPNRVATVSLSASGLTSGGYYDVSLDTTYLTTLVADGTGSLSTAGLHVPGAGCGDHELVLTQSAPILYFAAAALAVASAPYRVLCPSISVNPPRTTVAGLAAGVMVVPSGDFDYSGNDRYKQLLLDGNPLARIAYRQPITLTAAAGCGPHTVRLVQPSQFGVLDASEPLTVLCPTVALDPPSVTRGAAVAAYGASFDPKEPVSVSVDGTVVAGPPAGSPPYTDGSGGVMATLSTGDLGCGPHTVTVTELRPVPPPTAGATLTVRCPGPQVGPPPGRLARVSLDPAVVSAGMTTLITGSGFLPGSTVTLHWRLPDGSVGDVAGGPAVADASGHITVVSLLMDHDPTGARLLIAADPGAAAKAAAVVQGGTMQPSGGSGQIVFRR